MDQTNFLVFSQLPSKVSGSAALAFLISWPLVGACMLVRIVHGTADTAWEAALAYIIWGIQHLNLASHYWPPGAGATN